MYVPHIVCWLFPWSKVPLKRLLLGQNKILTGIRRLNHSYVVPESNWNKFKARHVKGVVSGTWSKPESFLHKRLSEVDNIDCLSHYMCTSVAYSPGLSFIKLSVINLSDPRSVLRGNYWLEELSSLKHIWTSKNSLWKFIPLPLSEPMQPSKSAAMKRNQKALSILFWQLTIDVFETLSNEIFVFHGNVNHLPAHSFKHLPFPS